MTSHEEPKPKTTSEPPSSNHHKATEESAAQEVTSTSASRKMGRPRFKTPAPSRSPMAILLSFLVLTLPPILYIVGMGLAVAAQKTPDFVRQNVLDLDSDFQNRDDLVHHQSPWFSCPFSLDFNEPDSFEEFCVRREALGQEGTDACISADDGLDPKDMVCPKITMVAELYTAGAVLLGIGSLVTFMFAVASCVTTRPKSDREEDHTGGNTDAMTRFIGSFGYLTGLGGAACLIAGQILGYTVMVVELSPPEVTQSDDFTRFFPGKALLTYTSTAYGLALGATFMGVTKCGLRH